MPFQGDDNAQPVEGQALVRPQLRAGQLSFPRLQKGARNHQWGRKGLLRGIRGWTGEKSCWCAKINLYFLSCSIQSTYFMITWAKYLTVENHANWCTLFKIFKTFKKCLSFSLPDVCFYKRIDLCATTYISLLFNPFSECMFEAAPQSVNQVGNIFSLPVLYFD